MGGYPPGTSAGDPNAPWNAPDMSHQHEWEPVEDMYPIFEDGAAIFVEQCRWEKALKTEPGYEGERVVTESVPCEERRTIRFEPVEIGEFKTGKIVHREDFTVEDDIIEVADGTLLPMVEQVLHDIEGNNAMSDEVDIVDLDPDWQLGHVIVEVNGYHLRYTPGTQTNREADD